MPVVQKVLLVDDEPDIRRIGVLSLTRVGKWVAVCAKNGGEALGLAQTEKPDVILLDVMMPVLDGLATMEQLREHPGTSHIPVIFMTAKVQKAETARYLAMGAAGVIQKPFDPMWLPAEILRILENPPVS